MEQLAFDELNKLNKGVAMPFSALAKFEDSIGIYFDADGKIQSKEDAEDIIDEMLDLFLMAYANGNEVTRINLGSDYEPSLTDAMKTINKEVAGKTWRERVWEYFDSGGTKADIIRIAETETHRGANESAYLTAKKAGATTKKWHCMMLPTSRDTHIYLDGVTAPIDGEFYSFKGGSTLFPGQWGIAEEDCNCLCWLTYSK